MTAVPVGIGNTDGAFKILQEISNNPPFFCIHFCTIVRMYYLKDESTVSRFR
jgi:hypothetical protein